MVQSLPCRWYVFYLEEYVRYLEPSKAMQNNNDCTQFIHTITCHFALPNSSTDNKSLAVVGFDFVIINICGSVFVRLLYALLNNCFPALLVVSFSCVAWTILVDNCLINQQQHWQQITGSRRARSIFLVIHIHGSVRVGLSFAPLKNCCPVRTF